MKHLILLFLLTLFTNAAFGQAGKLAIFMEAAPNYTFFRGNEVVAQFTQPIIRYAGGLGFEYSFTDNFSFRGAALFERKGFGIEMIATDIRGNPIGEMRSYSHADYIVVPLLLKASAGGNAKFFVNAGPYVGYLIQYKSITTPFQQFPGIVQDETRNFKPIDAGVSAGLGFSLPVGEIVRLSFEARSNLGFYNISNLPVVNNGSILTTSVNLMTGIYFSLK